MRHGVPARVIGAAALSLVLASAAFAQEAVPPQPPPEPTGDPPAQVTRSQWVMLMAVLGEQLPERAVLLDVALDVAPADVRIGVALPAGDATALEQLRQRLTRFFSAADVSPSEAKGPPGYAVYTATLTGVPSLDEYKAAKRAGQPLVVPATLSPAPPPTTAAPSPEIGPTAGEVRLRRVTESSAGGGLVAHVVVNNREYIAREGRDFANHRYRLVGYASVKNPPEGGTCVRIERLDTGETLTLCTE